MPTPLELMKFIPQMNKRRRKTANLGDISARYRRQVLKSRSTRLSQIDFMLRFWANKSVNEQFENNRKINKLKNEKEYIMSLV